MLVCHTFAKTFGLNIFLELKALNTFSAVKNTRSILLGWIPPTSDCAPEQLTMRLTICKTLLPGSLARFSTGKLSISSD